jgi:cation diffusion facilitator family transporter
LPATSNPLEKYAWLSIAAALATIGLKTLAWWLTESVGLLSDALESDGQSRRRPARAQDAAPCDNPSGRESSARVFEGRVPRRRHRGGADRSCGGGIIATAVPRLIEPRELQAPVLGLGLTVVASAINFACAVLLMRVGREEHSITLEADGKHLMADVWTSGGVIVGVALVFATGWLRLDPLVALAVAVHVIWTGVALVRRSASGLLDAAISREDQEELNKLLAEYSKRYGISFHAIRTRQAGARRFITFHILVPDAWTVAQAHHLSEEIESRIRSLVPNATLLTHIEPISDPASYDDQELDR